MALGCVELLEQGATCSEEEAGSSTWPCECLLVLKGKRTKATELVKKVLVITEHSIKAGEEPRLHLSLYGAGVPKQDTQLLAGTSNLPHYG